MALIEKDLGKIKLTPQKWTKWKMLTQKGNCKCWKDVSKVFELGLDTACNTNGIK